MVEGTRTLEPQTRYLYISTTGHLRRNLSQQHPGKHDAQILAESHRFTATHCCHKSVHREPWKKPLQGRHAAAGG